MTSLYSTHLPNTTRDQLLYIDAGRCTWQTHSSSEPGPSPRTEPATSPPKQITEPSNPLHQFALQMLNNNHAVQAIKTRQIAVFYRMRMLCRESKRSLNFEGA